MLSKDEPSGTHYRVDEYYDGDERICVVGYYWHPPDDTIGGSGLPDPKMIVQDGVEHHV